MHKNIFDFKGKRLNINAIFRLQIANYLAYFSLSLVMTA
jgi:hypothetical protein